ncbi:uncharacterized protein LOC122091155 isoform X2 [Macadamia integrifolia]|uniref:uncharacterized protein LOC122091155 isoform X2 n=1 Tax=Macadamia integrifolia TaxID=60698 RepID=UPI001C4F652E|nr:uncharacterized protein LOC122091155 isoform X2 [Macadamia integrifolia]
MAGCNRSEEYLASQEESAAAVGKKYGGLVPKKKPLISKQGGAGLDQKSKAAVETLRPKLERTPHQQLPPRRPACTSGVDVTAD